MLIGQQRVDFSTILSSIVASMYIEIGRCVVVDFPDEFGPEVLTEPRKSLKKMSE